MSVHPDFPCRHSWLQVQLYRMPWEGGCSAGLCHNPEMPIQTQSALEMCPFGNGVVEELFEDASCASWKVLFLTSIINFFNNNLTI